MTNVNRKMIGGCPIEQFLEAKLLFSFHKVKAYVQSIPTTNPCYTAVEEGVLGLHLSHTKLTKMIFPPVRSGYVLLLEMLL